MRPRKLFVAGSTGSTGRTLMRLCAALPPAAAVPVVPHLRPGSGRQPPPGAAVLDLGDRDALCRALSDCTTVIQLIGTMRNRFGRGDTYETSDIGTTSQLVEAARLVGAGIDHIILLSSVGAGSPMGAYLHAKARAEALVRESGIPYTIFRPSAFIGEGHRPPPGASALTRLFHLRRYEPIPIEDLAGAILHVAQRRAPLSVALEGESLWQVVKEWKAGVH